MRHLSPVGRPVFLGLLFLMLIGCQEASTVSDSTAVASSTEEVFQPLLDKVVSSNVDVPGIMFHLESAESAKSWTGVSGISDLTTKEKLQANQPFRIASVTKTFVATAILRLFEEGKLSLNDPISQYISDAHIKILKKGNYNPDQITIRQLLNHTSGLFDYCFGDETYVNKVKGDPHHRWTRTEQLQGAMDWGKPYGAPGEKYHYSDTGYILLGETIESLTGQSLAEALRTLIDFEKLGLTSTWLESLENAPSGVLDRAHQYLEDTDTYDWDPSMDLYGGGGLVSTTRDLARFYQQLFTNKVYAQPATLDTMLLKTVFPEPAKETEVANAPKNRQPDYRLGIEVLDINNTKVYMHTGFWGIQVVHLPELETSVAINFIQGSNYFFLRKVVNTIKEEVANN